MLFLVTFRTVKKWERRRWSRPLANLPRYCSQCGKAVRNSSRDSKTFNARRGSASKRQRRTAFADCSHREDRARRCLPALAIQTQSNRNRQKRFARDWQCLLSQRVARHCDAARYQFVRHLPADAALLFVMRPAHSKHLFRYHCLQESSAFWLHRDLARTARFAYQFENARSQVRFRGWCALRIRRSTRTERPATCLERTRSRADLLRLGRLCRSDRPSARYKR